MAEKRAVEPVDVVTQRRVHEYFTRGLNIARRPSILCSRWWSLYGSRLFRPKLAALFITEGRGLN